ncbi:MAG TPA: STAS domain-containing protein [Ignavibacteriales bacterium]|nr:STAS domain-containing protein [Ignavibacteriales bacterium]HOL81657.1 STAS domain-containing protein [Ignavibacteriales bacterium]HPP33771.1 STAS domain-containing protein [Ignavibacteriales bacterium]
MDELDLNKSYEVIKTVNEKVNSLKSQLYQLKNNENLSMEPFVIEKTNNCLIIHVNILRATMKDIDNYSNALGDFNTYGVNNVIYDLQRVEHIDSTFLGQIIGILKKVMEQNGKVLIVSNNESVKSLFVLTRLLRALPIYSSLDEALKNI